MGTSKWLEECGGYGVQFLPLVWSLWLLCALGCLTVNAQSVSIYASIVGTVTDPSGALVPDASVTVTNENTNISSRINTNGEGFYRVERLIQGTYRIQVEKAGFNTFVSTKVLVSEAQTVRVNAMLEPGSEIISVEVVEGPQLLGSESPQISHVLPFSIRRNLPTVAPSFFNTLTLFPGAVSFQSVYVAFNGSTSTQFNYSLDGQTFRDPLSGVHAFLGRFDEWQQDITVNSTNNSAEYSQLGEVNAATRSGANALQGSGAIYYTSGGLQGRNPFSPKRPSGANEFFAGSLGGPIKKNKAFFFAAYGGNRNRTAKVITATVPTALMRQGNFSEILPKTIIDPQTGDPFPGNIIPAGRLSPVATNFISRFYPLPDPGATGLTSNYHTDWSQAPAEDDVSGRVDIRFSDQHSVFGRYIFDEGNRGGFAAGSLPTVGYRQGYRRDQNAIISDLYAVSPSLYNEFSIGFSRDYNLILPSTDYGPTQSGLQIFASPVAAIPAMTIAGFTTVSQNNFFNSIGEIFNLRDALSWIHGRHSLKFGVLVLRGNNTSFSAFNGSSVLGDFSFTNTFATGYGMANFLLGLPPSESRIAPLSFQYQYLTRQSAQVFAEDEIQLGRTITVSLGLRYENQGPWSEKQNRLSNLDLRTGTLVVPNSASIQLLDPNLVANYGSSIRTAAQAGFPESMVDFSRRNFAPRVGFAWRAFANTVARAGYGIYYDFNPPGTQIGSELYVSPESYPVNSISNGVPLYQFPNPFATVTPIPGFGILSPRAAAAQERIPYSQQWSLTMERQFGNSLARLSYVGTAGVDQLIAYDANVPPPATVQLGQSARPLPQFGPITWVQNGPGHHYNALTAEFLHRRGVVFFDSNFTWAKDIGLNQGNGIDQSIGVLNPFDAKMDYGPTQYIPRFRWVSTANWQLPVGRKGRFASSVPVWANYLVGDWSVSAFYTAQSGDWLTPTYCGYDPTGSPGQDFYCGRPDRIARGVLASSQRSESMWFNPAAFVFPGATAANPLTPPANPIGRFGNSGVGIIEGPGLWQFDLGMIKNVPLRESFHLRLFAFATNLFNHPSLANPSMDISVPSTVGRIFDIRSRQIAEANDPGIGMRVLTIGARFEF